ncbi:aminotransferase class V-fold PLP-dependent enzyme [Nocardia callitridis]|uniref:Cysteine desulfurase n=1 Tax=Nocardia callitridis TaxID=648753 RepID=A0ABP9K1S9_9NOCA
MRSPRERSRVRTASTDAIPTPRFDRELEPAPATATDLRAGSAPQTGPASGRTANAVPPRDSPSETATLGDLRGMFPAVLAAARTETIYLDSAATTQKPLPVIEAIDRYHSARTANSGRGTYPWATGLTEAIARVRERTARFIGAEHTDEVVFTGGATAALNAIAMSWAVAELRAGDEILYSPNDHAANVFPWHQVRGLLGRFGQEITLVPYRTTVTGEADTADILAKLTPRTRLLTVSHLHHVFGALNTLTQLRGRIDPSVRLCFDASQSGGHVPVDVTALGADFAVFAAHKMLGAPGLGILYCRRRVHAELLPFLPGGNSAVRIDTTGLVPGAMPELLEGGTPNIPAVLGLERALDVLQSIGMPKVAAHNRALTVRLVDGLRPVRRLRFLPGPAHAACGVGYGIVSFTLDGISAADLGFVLSEFGFMVRTGGHCVPASGNATAPSDPAQAESVRVSTHVYNTVDDIDRFVLRVRAIADELG